MIPEEYFTCTPILNKSMNTYLYTGYYFSKGFIDYANANESEFCLWLLIFSICPHAFTSVDRLPFINKYISNLVDRGTYILSIED